MKITFIQPGIGQRQKGRYIRTWQMEPLGIATLAALTPGYVDKIFFDDRMEEIPFDRPTDLVALTVETYTAKRSYQIASEYRRRGIPVVMGGFHPTLLPEEAALWADSVIVGNAESVWNELIEDYRSGNLRSYYGDRSLPELSGMRPDYSIFGSRRYLPVGLVEAGRGCPFSCDFCAVAGYYQSRTCWHPVDKIAKRIWEAADRQKLVFLVDDHFCGDRRRAKELCRILLRRPVKWVTQSTLEALGDGELVDLMVKSGCQGVLIGFESLEQKNLISMNKGINQVTDYSAVLRNLDNTGLRIYGTFVFGYDSDTIESFAPAVAFAREHNFYVSAFNHLVPFPGTPLYARLRDQGRLLYDKWWLEDDITFNKIVFNPANMSADDLREHCLRSRRSFYSLPGILKRSMGRANRNSAFMLLHFFLINAIQRYELKQRDGYPLGDENWKYPILQHT